MEKKYAVLMTDECMAKSCVDANLTFTEAKNKLEQVVAAREIAEQMEEYPMPVVTWHNNGTMAQIRYRGYQDCLEIIAMGEKPEAPSEFGFPTAWILTDDDCFQIRREVSKGVFELYQIQTVPATGKHEEEQYGIAHAIVYPSDIDVDSVVSAYVYDSLEKMKEFYGDETDAILAECSFEMDAACMENLITKTPMNFSEARDRICNMADYKIGNE